MVEVVVFSVCKRAAKRGGASQPPQKRGAEASRVDPEAGPVILAHMRGRLRAAVARNEIEWEALDEATRTELEALFAERNPLIVDPTALERKFTIPERNRAMVREFREILEKGYTGPNGIRRAPDWGKTIVFAVTKRHAETLARMFDQEFADKKPSPTTRYADFVVSGLGPDDTVDGQAKIKRFKKEEFPQILVSVNMLDTGFDCPEVRNLVMARFTHSSILYQQMRGRGTRLSPGKSRFTMFDFTGVTLRHGDDEMPGEGGVVVVCEATRPPAQPRRLLTLDVHDEIDPTTREWVTVDETGHAFLDADEAAAEALGAAFETWLNEEEFHSDRRPRQGVRLLWRRLPARHLRQHEDGRRGDHGASPFGEPAV